jgi:hypothetical protein
MEKMELIVEEVYEKVMDKVESKMLDDFNKKELRKIEKLCYKQFLEEIGVKDCKKTNDLAKEWLYVEERNKNEYWSERDLGGCVYNIISCIAEWFRCDEEVDPDVIIKDLKESSSSRLKLPSEELVEKFKKIGVEIMPKEEMTKADKNNIKDKEKFLKDNKKKNL